MDLTCPPLPRQRPSGSFPRWPHRQSDETITLVFYDESSDTWVDTHPCTGCVLDTDANVLVTLLDHTTAFAAVGEAASGERIFLPLLLHE